MTFGSLFAGVGGFDLGLERAGMQCQWQVEIDPYARRVLEKHWPDVRRHDDVRTFPPPGEWGVDLICGGFPCQDISSAGLRVGIDGERSGLWSEYARIVGVLRPRYVVVENVADLLARGIDRVLGDLSGIGYDAEWSTLSACTVGAPHARRRLFIVAYPDSQHGPARLGNRTKRQGEIFKHNHRQGTWADPERKPLETEAGDDRMADGISGRMVGLGGNAIVHQVAELIGRLIMESEENP